MNHKLLIIITIVVSVMLFIACSEKQQIKEIPEQGKIEYELYYSSSLSDNVIFGFALPKKLCCVYNDKGVKMSSQCGLGIIKGDIVCSTQESFMTMRVDENRLILPLSDFINSVLNIQNTDSAATVKYYDETFIIGGQDSKKIDICYKSSLFEDSVKVELYYVPIPFEREFQFVTDSKITKLPGLITSMNLSSGDMSILIVMKDIENEEISESEFIRPEGYRASTVQQIDSLVMSFF